MSTTSFDEATVAHLLTGLVVRFLRVPEAEVTADADLIALGLDSVLAVEMAASLSDTFGKMIDHGPFLEQTTVTDIAAAIVRETS